MSIASPWTETRRACLRAFCDTVFPRLHVQPDPHGFWNRTASDFGIETALLDALELHAPAQLRVGALQLFDALASLGMLAADQPQREQLLHRLMQSSPLVAVGVQALIRTTLVLCYALPDVAGRNPNWVALGYPGPPRAAAAPVLKPIRPLVIDRGEVTLDADVCIVGSGAGGGVMAGELARRGMQVVVLEAGGYYNEADFNQLELWSLRNLYWRGGYQMTSDATMRLIAGGALGGGTLVNWENCVRPPEWVRREWAREHGLEGVDGPEFDAMIERVSQRLSINDRCSDLNGPHMRFELGARRLGYHFERAHRNVDPARYAADTAGFHGYGDITGSRQSTVNTYLADAQGLGAQILVRTRALRILTAAGRASGVEATSLLADGRRARVTVRSKHVVAACGALETPGLLLRSGLGGPAVGSYLHLHPCVGLTACHADDQLSWWGPPQAALSDQFLRLEADHGFLLEGIHHGTGASAGALTWQSGAEHKRLMAESAKHATLIAIVRDRGHGRVTLDGEGASVINYPMSEPLDSIHLQRGLVEIARLHEAAGARCILAPGRYQLQQWQRGEDLEAWASSLAVAPGDPRGQSLSSAHQMGSARMGTDPQTSVANPAGELHGTPGVWIGDTSAFPSAVGVNPMLTCMSLALRTAERIAR
jgi:choline dehydrogenase-like flavoprotein